MQLVCDSMTSSKRISITVSEKELTLWNEVNPRESLSAFIREAVNEYVKIQTPEQKMSLFDFFLKQNDEFSQIKKKLIHLERIEGELIDLTAAMAKFDMIDIVGDQWEIKKK
ncbi:hypothetical protein NEF87_003690 [Candidatus Lokiarchaeum ossiferum]|uniref:CopG family transcriptional regulator n=1 Tax=Candidatus Lokiarchaeum ossiferum TaxID=2951803 RepID=A0ABY6HVG7_9ARCH|nr:hypothetical protein NEF87_003690 [Candidatus Lokiarchaeum sp. B-35]